MPPESCPNFNSSDDDDLGVYADDAQVDGATSVVEGTHVSLPAGEALDLAQVAQFLRWRPATFVTIVGDRDSGKSTLICALYDRLLRGPYANMSFAGSRTLVELERRSHYSRADSGRVEPETPRTSLSEGLHYFHIALVPAGHSARVDLLISDRAGEIYSQARDDSAIITSLVEVPQGDRVVLLLDGRRVSNPVERSNAMQAVRQTLRAFLDNDALGAASIVQVVTTKTDLIAACGDTTHVEEALSLFERRLARDFGPRLRELTFCRVAARDPIGKFEPAHGLDTLLTDWVASRSQSVSPPPPLLILESEFDKLLARTPLEAS